MISAVLFDLDGTLTDPGEGITNSVAYALRCRGIAVPEREALYAFIGPPLSESFMRYFDLSAEEAEDAIRAYRVYFRDRGIFENRVYDGIAELLQRLHDAGCRIVLATSKPEVFARQILSHFHLIDLFDQVTGASMDGSLCQKGDVIAKALRDAGIDPSESVMVGDRRYDMEGAHQNGMRAVGVLYGYGSRAELTEAGADAIASDVASLGSILFALRSEEKEDCI